MSNWQSKFYFYFSSSREHFPLFRTFQITKGGLYDCCDDANICCYGCWCTACLYGKNAVQIDDSDYDDACWTYMLANRNPAYVVDLVNNRRALREKYGLPEEPCDDCSVISCYTPCAVCQAARELKIRNNMSGEYILLIRILSHFCTSNKKTTIQSNGT